MKEVNIYIKESCDSLDTKEGHYTAVMTTQGGKCKFSNSFPDTTNYRMIIQGAIDAISKLNQPCIVNLFTNTTFGMNKIMKSDGSWRDLPKNSVNIDLLKELKDIIIDGGHNIVNFYDKDLVDEAFESYENENTLTHLVIKLNQNIYNKLNSKCKQEGKTPQEFIESMLESIIK